MYLRFSTKVASNLDLRNTNEWRSYDPVRAHRGLQEFIRQDMSDFSVLWN